MSSFQGKMKIIRNAWHTGHIVFSRTCKMRVTFEKTGHRETIILSSFNLPFLAHHHMEVLETFCLQTRFSLLNNDLYFELWKWCSQQEAEIPTKGISMGPNFHSTWTSILKRRKSWWKKLHWLDIFKPLQVIPKTIFLWVESGGFMLEWKFGLIRHWNSRIFENDNENMDSNFVHLVHTMGHLWKDIVFATLAAYHKRRRFVPRCTNYHHIRCTNYHHQVSPFSRGQLLFGSPEIARDRHNFHGPSLC